MKKSLFSLLIMSTISLSNQAIAVQEEQDEILLYSAQKIDIRGQVVKNQKTCSIDIPPGIHLGDINIDEGNIEDHPPKEINFKFSNCDKENMNSEVGIKIKKSDKPYLTNNSSSKDASNLTVELLNKNRNNILLTDDFNREIWEKVNDGSDAEIKIYAKYKKPENEEIKISEIFTTLDFDVYMSNSIKE